MAELALLYRKEDDMGDVAYRRTLSSFSNDNCFLRLRLAAVAEVERLYGPIHAPAQPLLFEE